MFNTTALYRTAAQWQNGMLYIGNHLIEARTDENTCTLREGTASVASFAFAGCENTASVILPASINGLGAFAIGFNTSGEAMSVEIKGASKAASAYAVKYGISYECRHLVTELKNELEPTCALPGKTADTVCTVCSAVIAPGVAVAATGNHEWDNGEQTKAPSCTETGTIVFTCLVCSEQKQAGIPRLEHSMSEYETITTVSCEVDGVERRVCLNPGCTYSEDLVIRHTGHSCGSWTEVRAAAFGETGVMRSYCQNPGCEYYTELEIPAGNDDKVSTSPFSNFRRFFETIIRLFKKLFGIAE